MPAATSDVQNDIPSVTKKLGVPELSRSATAEDIEKALKLAGCCFIRNYISKEDAAQIERDVRPDLEADLPWEGSFFPKETRRAFGLIGASETWAEKVLMDPVFQKVCDRFLTVRSWHWEGDQKIYSTSKPQVNATTAIAIGPGGKAQQLHRDDVVHHNHVTEIDVYPEDLQPSAPKRETSIGIFVAGKKATKENGATECVPGSHLWATERQPTRDNIAYAAMDPGDAFVMLGSTYHAGGYNSTTDEERLLYAAFVTRGMLRQEENQFLSIPLDVMKKRSAEVQKMAGYQVSQPFLGWVKLSDPRALLDPTVQERSDHSGAAEDEA